MKQFATGTAVLKTPRPITFELAFLAAVAAAACETSHTRVSPWDGGSALHCLRFLCPETGQCWARENPGVWGLVTYLGCLGGRLGLSCPGSSCPVNWSQQ